MNEASIHPTPDASVQTELERLKAMYKYETAYYEKGYKVIAGVDEAGRGPLAGPVVSAVAILPVILNDGDFVKWEGLNDSKKLSAKKRELLYNRLIDDPRVHLGIGIASEKIIDKFNILRATQLTMRKALANLDVAPSFLLVDGMRIPDIKVRQLGIVDGDSLSLSVAAASIVAKVTRDNIMNQYHEKFPQYGFDKHKGYGTNAHLEKLRQYGPCRIHRKSFSPITLMQEIGVSDEI